MKAEELMIGDWIIAPINEYPIKITGINGQDIIVYNEEDYTEYPYFITDTKPIPLTTKILEKNSFLQVEEIEYPSHRVGISFLYRITPEGLRIFVQNACAGWPTCTMIKTCKYVHEIQHMIKMCNITKDIVL